MHGTEHKRPEEAAQVANGIDLVRVRVRVRVKVGVRVRVRVRVPMELTTAIEQPRSAAGCVVWCSAQCVGMAALVTW